MGGRSRLVAAAEVAVRHGVLTIDRVRQRLAGDDGFGMVELLIAMTLLAVAIGALMLSFASSALSLRRAGQKGTALTLADTQMEWYRRLSFTGVRIDGSLIPASGTYVAAHSSDSTIPPATGQAVAGANGDAACSGGGSEPVACLPVQNVTGPDGRAYRIDTYVNYVNNDSTLSIATPSSGLTLKRVTVVVRDGTTGTILAREQSAFVRE
jgi:prepilin-type N-terminal cleavage/methylation domain-containing protein